MKGKREFLTIKISNMIFNTSHIVKEDFRKSNMFILAITRSFPKNNIIFYNIYKRYHGKESFHIVQSNSFLYK